MKIYTLKGDKGNTNLLTGEVVPKSHPKVKAYGNLDKLNSHLGLLISEIELASNSSKELLKIKEIICDIQLKLFPMASHLACGNNKLKELPKLNETWVLELERQIDHMQNSLPTLKNFIIPGGSKLAAITHITRTVCRETERLTVDVASDVDGLIIKYLNRLSDFLFVLARYLNKLQGREDIIWKL